MTLMRPLPSCERGGERVRQRVESLCIPSSVSHAQRARLGPLSAPRPQLDPHQRATTTTVTTAHLGESHGGGGLLLAEGLDGLGRRHLEGRCVQRCGVGEARGGRARGGLDGAGRRRRGETASQQTGSTSPGEWEKRETHLDCTGDAGGERGGGARGRQGERVSSTWSRLSGSSPALRPTAPDASNPLQPARLTVSSRAAVRCCSCHAPVRAVLSAGGGRGGRARRRPRPARGSAAPRRSGS